MIDQIIANLLRKTLETQTPKFSGSKEENVTDWVKTVTVEFKLAHCPEHEKLDWVPTFLSGEALLWYMKRKSDIQTWSAFIEEMQKEYSMEEKQSQNTDSQRKLQPHVYHQQHLQRTYDQYSLETIVFEETTTVMDTEELEWPKQGEPWADSELKEQMERFQKTPNSEYNILISHTQLSTTSAEDEEEINDDKQVQLPSGTMDKDRTLLLSKLYDVMKQFRLKRKSQSVPSSWSLLQFALSSTGLSCPCFHNGSSGEDSLLSAVDPEFPRREFI
ncbi:unnamed protein product [Didymodactylos carnosus]|uniref:Retrotransposon gag domain-containing protein n=1 Tax=Didymodactylos carnosus TaxID=1234261 RepID=A0A8S2QMY9_9BILA|nr:unnamed protein product [Didymodactylos carnosus]CAF4108272.1 unnamed protein product [Didymodactylos carnosus]